MFSRVPDAFTSHHTNNLPYRRQYFVPRQEFRTLNRRKYIVKRPNNDQKKICKWWKVAPTVSIVGHSRIRSTDNSFGRRIIWLCVLLACFGCLVWQVWDCTRNFFDQPVRKTVELARDSEIQFPAVYLCQGFMRDFVSSVFKENLQQCSLDGHCFNDPLNKLVFRSYLSQIAGMTTADELWNLENKDELQLFRPCINVNDNCTVKGTTWNMNRLNIKTFWGACSVLNTVLRDRYRGPFTYFTLEYKLAFVDGLVKMLNVQLLNTTDPDEIKRLVRSRNRDRVGIMIYLHHKYDTKMSHLMFFRAHELLQGFITHVGIHKKVIKRVNRRVKRCLQSDDEVVDCYNKCIEKKMSETCRMPYVFNTPDNVCLVRDRRNYNYLEIHLENYQAYSKLDMRSCNCVPACKEISFTPSIDVVEKLSNKSHVTVKFYFGSNSYDRITEKLAYEFTEYLSDVGGNLGYFLGGCILNILEIIEYMLYVLKNHRYHL